MASIGVSAMSLLSVCIWAFLRGLAVMLLGLPLAVRLKRRLTNASGWESALAWSILLLPLVAPHLVTGYGYAHFSLSLIHHPIWNELLYDLLLLTGCVPAGVVLLYFAPEAPISHEAIHCARLVARCPASGRRRRSMPWPQRFGIWARGPVRNLIPAGALMFLIAFQEFEIASMMLIPTWTIWLFDAQTGGLPATHTLQYAALPLLFEIIVLAPAVFAFCPSLRLSPRPRRRSDGAAQTGMGGLWCYLALSASLYCFIPWSLVLSSSWGGYPILLSNRTLSSDIVHGLVMALVSGSLVYGAVFWMQMSKPRTSLRRIVTPIGLLTVLTGLLGALTVSLVLLAIFQLPVAYRLYDTPLPWLCGLVWFLAPRAWLVVLVLVILQRREPIFLARLLARSAQTRQRSGGLQLLWKIQWMRHFCGILLICYWAYLDGTIAAMLAPAAWVSSPVRLVNLMHYGQSSVLSSMVVVTFATPLIGIALLLSIRRSVARHWTR
jgi:iron(III) transport system permease protein